MAVARILFLAAIILGFVGGPPMHTRLPTQACASSLTEKPSSTETAANKLDDTLRKYEQAIANVRSLTASCTRTAVDKVFGTTEVYEGTLAFERSKPGQTTRAALDMRSKSGPGMREKWNLQGKTLYLQPAGKSDSRR